MFEYENHHFLYLDIETKSQGEPDFEQLKTEEEWLKEAPKSYSKPKQEQWAKDKAANQINDLDKEFRKKALNSLESDLVCIGLAIDDKEPVVIKYDKNEKHMIEELEAYLEGELRQHRFTVVWVGSNIAKFDITRLWHRAVKHKMVDLMRMLPVEKWSKRIQELNDLFNINQYGVYTSLGKMSEYLGFGGKEDMNGACVHDLFLEGKLDGINDYCVNGDVRRSRMCHRSLLGLPQLESDLKNVK